MDVTSFGIDHDVLLRGIYVSRKDTVGNGVLTTFDIRMKEPNREMVMDTSVMHTIEHLMAFGIAGLSLDENNQVSGFVGSYPIISGMRFEMDLTKFLEIKTSKVRYTPVSKFPYLVQITAEISGNAQEYSHIHKDEKNVKDLL